MAVSLVKADEQLLEVPAAVVGEAEADFEDAHLLQLACHIVDVSRQFRRAESRYGDVGQELRDVSGDASMPKVGLRGVSESRSKSVSLKRLNMAYMKDVLCKSVHRDRFWVIQEAMSQTSTKRGNLFSRHIPSRPRN